MGAITGLNAADNFQGSHHRARVEKQAELDAGGDKRQNHQPDLERWYATRAKMPKVEVSGASHRLCLNRRSGAVIEEAASERFGRRGVKS